MMKLHINHENNLTIRTAIGSVSEKEVFESLRSFYASSPTKLELLDLSLSSLDRINLSTLERIKDFWAKWGQKRRGGKTAILIPSDSDHMIGQLYLALSSKVDFPFSFKLFRSKKEAMEWLFQEA